MISTVWPCSAARAPMALAMLPEPMMLMLVMMGLPLLVAGLCGVVTSWSVPSDQSADDLVEGFGLAGLVVEPGATPDQGTAEHGSRPEGACGPPVADREP